jgi:transcriptional regulator with XRE-family HTH domain
MAQDDNDELKRVSSMRLFGALIPYIDKNIFKLFIIPQVTSFADDPSANLRKEVANLLGISQSYISRIEKKVIKDISNLIKI